MKVSEACNMGMHAVMYLAANPGRIVPLKEIARKLSVSENHLSKVLQRLGKTEVVKATRGPSGGYVLARDSDDIPLLEVYQTLEGPIKPKFCLFHHPVCVLKCCGLGELIGRQNQELQDFLSKARIKDFSKVFEGGVSHEKKNSSNQ